MSEFKNVLAMLRKRNNLTQNDLGALLGMSGSSISMYERGERIPSKEALEVIADHFNVPIDYLLGREDVNEAPALSENETALLDGFRALNEQGQEKALEYIELLLMKGENLAGDNSAAVG